MGLGIVSLGMVSSHFGYRTYADAAAAAKPRDRGAAPDPAPRTAAMKARRYKYVGRWGEAGTGLGQFKEPHGINFDLDGNVLLTENKLCHVYRFTPQGKLLGEFKADAKGYVAPRDVAQDAAGNVYVADADAGRVLRFDSTGGLIATWGDKESGDAKLIMPMAIGIGRNGRIYITDVKSERVKVYDPSGKYLFGWGKPGTGPGEFDSPHGITVDPAGNVFVSEYEGGRCQKFTADGVHLLTFAVSGSPPHHVHSVTSDRIGNVYLTVRVLAPGNETTIIAKYSNDGVFITQFAPPASAAPHFVANCAAADSLGRVFVADRGEGSVGVHIFAPVTR